jgi:prevent-host-death family protein
MLTLQDAKNRFSAVVEAALAGRAQHVSRRGKPAVVIVAASDYKRLVTAAAANRPSFKDHLLSFPAEGDFERAEVKPRDVVF